MSMIKGITIELDGNTTKLESALKKVDGASKKAGSELKQIERLIKFNPKNTELLAQKQKVLGQQVDATSTKLKALKAAQEQVNDAYKKGDISEEQYRKFQRELIKTESQLKHYEQQLFEATDKMHLFGQRAKEAGESLKKIGGQMTSVGRDLSLKVTAPLVAIGTAATMVGMDFRAGLSEVQAISGATGAEMQKLEVRARELGSSTKFSAKEVTDGFKFMSMAGWDVKQSLDGIDGFLNLAAASGSELAVVSDILTDAISAFGDEAKDAGRYADVIASASSNANTNVEMLGESFKYVAPVAGALGYSLEDTAVALGLMANAGIKSSSAGTALRGALTNLVKPTKAMEKEMKSLGINVLDANKEMKPLDQLLREMRKSFATLTEDQKASAAATIFGKEAMSGMLAVLNASDTEFDSLTESIRNSEGAAEQMARTMQDNLKGSITNLKSAVEEAGIKIYDAMEPTLAMLVDRGQKAVDWFNSLDKSTQQLIVTTGGLAAAIGPLLVVGGSLVTGVGMLMTYIPALIPLLSGIAVPVGVLTAAIVGLGVAYALTREKADESLLSSQQVAESNLELAKSHTDTAMEIKENVNATSDLLDAHKQAVESTEELITTFEDLSKKSKLTNEELGEYMTLQTQLSNTTSPDKVKELKERMEELQKKSGLTKEEMQLLLQSNEDLMALYPELGAEVDEYGNELLTTTDNVRGLTEAEQERLALEIYSQMLDDLEDMNILMAEYEGILDIVLEAEQRAIDLTKEQAELKKDINSYNSDIAETELAINELTEGRSEWEKLTNIEYQKQYNELVKQKGELEKKKDIAEKNLGVIDETLETEKGIVEEHRSAKDLIGQTLQANGKNLDKYREIKSEQLGINIEKGNEIKSIETAIKKEQEKLNKLQEQIKKEGDVNGEKQKQVDKTQEQIKKLNETKVELGNLEGKQKDVNTSFDKGNDNLAIQRNNIKKNKGEIDNSKKSADQMNQSLAKNIKKDVTVKTNKDADKENEKWSKPIQKVISFFTRGEPNAHAEGTNYAPGGPTFLGEEGPELVRVGTRMSIADFGLYDLPKGAKVWTAEETQRMLQGANQTVNSAFRASQPQSQTINIAPAPIYLDGRVIGEATFNVVDTNLGNKQAITGYMRGV